jgi:hypothetical protein
LLDGGANLLFSQRFIAGELSGQGIEHAESVGRAGQVC